MSFPLRILCRASIWCGESCSDAFEMRSSANFTESLKRSIANSIFPYTGMNVSSDPSDFAVHESSCHEIVANASDWLKRCELISIPLYISARIFLGVGRLHPKVSLLFELNTLPLKWEGMKRCIEFWVKVMRMGEDRLLKQVMMQVMELGDGVQWRQDLEKKFKDVWVGRIAS